MGWLFLLTKEKHCIIINNTKNTKKRGVDMVIGINEYSDIPIYLQIRNQIVIGISEGKLMPGEQLPTVRGLAEEVGVNSMTVNKAYQLLKQEGYIYTDRRNGAKVKEVMSLSEELPKETKDMLQRVISEAKIRGIDKKKFYEICNEFYVE